MTFKFLPECMYGVLGPTGQSQCTCYILPSIGGHWAIGPWASLATPAYHGPWKLALPICRPNPIQSPEPPRHRGEGLSVLTSQALQLLQTVTLQVDLYVYPIKV